MAMSFEQFHAALLSADHRAALGLQLTDADAHAVHADPTTAQNWYSYWLSTQPESAPPVPFADPVAFAAPADAQATAVYGQAPFADAHATAAYATTPLPEFAAYPGSAAGFAQTAMPVKKKHTALWVILSIVVVLLLAIIGTTIFAFATARHWTAVDVPEQPETFHTEEYETGLFDVTMDEVSPCWVNQDWTDCTNLYVASYNAACTGVGLTPAGSSLCTDYAGMIEEMKSQDGDGYYVATLGGNGSLHRTAERATREVSNNDYKPAETHEAVCYLGFIGECGTSVTVRR